MSEISELHINVNFANKWWIKLFMYYCVIVQYVIKKDMLDFFTKTIVNRCISYQ